MRFASSFDYVDNAIVPISAIDRHRTAEIVEDVWVELVTLHYRSIEENFEDTCVAGDAISRMPRKFPREYAMTVRSNVSMGCKSVDDARV